MDVTRAEAIAAVRVALDGLPAETQAAIRGRVRFEVRSRPGPLDLAAGRDVGLTERSPGYFLGRRVGDESDELEEDEGGETATDPTEPGGVVVLFAFNVDTPAEIQAFIDHEIGHFLGADEDELEELSGDVSEAPEILEVYDGDEAEEGRR